MVAGWSPPAGERRRAGGLAVRTLGHGDDVVFLLHGLMASGDSFGGGFDRLAAGSRLLLLYGAAGRDSRAHACPAAFSPGSRSATHLAFGHGIHFCLGAPLARAEARCGVIPAAAAEQIAAGSRIDDLDFDLLRHETEIVGYPILPLVHQLVSMCGEAGRYVHWGATTQDIMDTANVLQVRAALDMLDVDIRELRTILAGLARRIGRPMLPDPLVRHALPLLSGLLMGFASLAMPRTYPAILVMAVILCVTYVWSRRLTDIGLLILGYLLTWSAILGL